MLAGWPSSGGWEGPASLLGRLMERVTGTTGKGQPGQGEAGAGGSPLLRPEDCVRLVEAFLPRGPELAGPAVRAHRAAYGHVVCALVQLAGEGVRGGAQDPSGRGSPGGSSPRGSGPSTPGGSEGTSQAGLGEDAMCGARAAVALCRALGAAFRWLLAGGRGTLGAGVPEEGEEGRADVKSATEAGVKELVELMWSGACLPRSTYPTPR
jgi:hypothetical protein